MRLLTAAAICGSFFAALTLADSNATSKQQSQQVLKGDFKPPQVFKNNNLVRTTSLEKGYVRETINVIVENIDKQPQSEYYIPFEYDVFGKIGGLDVRDKKDASKPRFLISAVALDAVLDETVSAKPTQYYVVKFPQPLASKSQITLSISYHILGALSPLPSTIKQDEKQYLSFNYSAYAPSAYTTIKQKTNVKFPSSDISEYTITRGLKSSTDPERQGSKFTYGEYDTSKTPIGATYPIKFRYEFTKPLLANSLLERDIEVSHWGGNLATEERYWLRNDGAELANHFSRVSWAHQSYFNGPTSALKELKYPLKPGSVDPYFTDDIGNVSTSRYRPNKVREASLELKPRYPLFGGWKYSFRIGWNNALSDSLRKLKQGDTYALSVPFLEGPKQPEGIQYDHVQVRVILPEGAKNVKWDIVGANGGVGLPTLESSTSLHRTFLDTLGRTEIKLTAQNVIDEARDGVIYVTYDYPSSAMYRKPLTLIAGTITVFVTAWAIGQLDTSIGRK